MMLSKKSAFAIALITIFVVADVGMCITADDASATTDGGKIVSDPDDIRLQIYGNANGDDYIDEKDIAVLNSIIDSNTSNWESTYPFADANQDGIIDSTDVENVSKIINGEAVKMYYLNRYDYVSYVNYPISTNIMCSNVSYPLLYVTRTFDHLVAIDQSTWTYMGMYDGWNQYVLIPNLAQEHTLESLTSAMSQGANTFIQWTGGGGSNYLWEMSNIDDIASEMSIVTVHIMGPDCIKGALMFAQMLGDIHLADDYKEWYDEALDRFSAIGTTIEKKTVTVAQCFGSSEFGTYRLYGSEMAPAYWFNVVLNFQDMCKGKDSITVIGSMEELVTVATDEIVLMGQRDGVSREDYNTAMEERLNRIFANMDQLNDGKIYVIDWDIMPYFGGPAGCYVLAAYLYPEYYDIDEALDFMQTYLDLFEPGEADARVGFTYPMVQSSTGVSDSEDYESDGNLSQEHNSGSDNTILYVAIAVIAILIVAIIAMFVFKSKKP